jgi:hypothetical protein
LREVLVAGAGGAVLLSGYGAIFLPLLPNTNGAMGFDYSYQMPALLAGYFWYVVNGLGQVPWFTPAFCGGVPFLANAQIAYYSLPQFLTFAMPPVIAVQATFLVFAVLGYLGFYALLRRTFALNPWPAFLGAGIFLFNGFFAHRMLIGHLGFHAFMLMPMAALFLVPASPPGNEHVVRRHLAPVLGAGLVFAYMFHSGLFHALPVVATTVVALALIRALGSGWTGHDWGAFALRCAMAAGVTVALCATKLTAGIAFHGLFPRNYYLLPGVAGLIDSLRVAFLALFVGPPEDLINKVLVNARWMLERQELEYGVTAVPLVVALVGAAILVARWARGRGLPRPGTGQMGLIAVLVVVLAVPLVLNWYTPAWNGVLKQVPLFRESSNLFRWIALYIPLAILAAAMALDRAVPSRNGQALIAFAGVASVVGLNAIEDRGFYAQQTYRPSSVHGAYEDVRTGRWTPRVDHIAIFLDGQGRPSQPAYRNDSLTSAGSQALCHQPTFGYRLERFPFGALRPGPVGDAQDGLLNIKKPACFVYPRENACRPGDHYSAAETDAATAFAAYRPVPFAVPVLQRMAGAINIGALVLVPILLVVAAWRAVRLRTAANP